MKLNEKNIFLLDGVGALLSAIATGLALPFFQEWTGLVTIVTLPLAVLALAFSVYSFSCYWLVPQPKPWMLLAIISANIGYCVLSLALARIFPGVKFWGIAFLLAEALIVLGVVSVEWMVYRRAKFFRQDS